MPSYSRLPRRLKLNRGPIGVGNGLFSAHNDRSRWLAMRALVERGTYAVEQYVTDPTSYPNWDSIDLVMHQDADGNPHLYSSKPPLLATLYAGPYWAICRICTAIHGSPVTAGTNPYEIDRAMLILVNVLPLVIYFIALAAMIEHLAAATGADCSCSPPPHSARF